jgi:hypothetical protein
VVARRLAGAGRIIHALAEGAGKALVEIHAVDRRSSKRPCRQ